MFPSITIVAGNAYEFKDMCAKYYIHSFPNILYFKSGRFLSTYEDEYNAPSIARKFAKWTKSLPKSIPVKNRNLKNTYYPSTQNFFSVNFSNFSSFLFLADLNIPIPTPNIEPFIGSVDAFETWDISSLFFISGLFVLVRLLFVIKSYRYF